MFSFVIRWIVYLVGWFFALQQVTLSRCGCTGDADELSNPLVCCLCYDAYLGSLGLFIIFFDLYLERIDCFGCVCVKKLRALEEEKERTRQGPYLEDITDNIIMAAAAAIGLHYYFLGWPTVV